ncbi:MAG: hypothetical protein ACREPE_14065 [Lysobacter sp.]
MLIRRFATAVLITALGAPLLAAAQKPHDPTALLAAQRDAMAPLAKLDGHWRGTATMTSPTGASHVITQTERIGPLLDGTVKVIEGRGYDTDGNVAFNALAIVSFDPAKRAYNFRSYAQGHSGDFVFTPTADGFVWEIPAGPMTMRYTSVVKGDTWSEIGERIEPGKPPVKFVELKLQRIGASDWPAAGAVAAK